MKFLFTNTKSEPYRSGLSEIKLGSLLGSWKLFAVQPLMDWESSNSRFIVLGSIVGLRDTNGTIEGRPRLEDLKAALENPSKVKMVEGSFVVFCLSGDGSGQVWSDQFGRVDIYFQKKDEEVFIASGLNFLPVSRGYDCDIDHVGMMQAMYIYGGRPAKKHTWYKSVKRLGVSEILNWNSNCELYPLRNPKPDIKIQQYVEPQSLIRYSDIFIEAIRARASKQGNVVFLSSGWDSTAILATLVHLFGKSKTRAVIGRMKYSDRSGVCNQFEMERAIAMADYFGIRLDVVDLDYRSGITNLKDKLDNTYRAQQFTSLTGFNHWMLAEFAASTSSGGEVVFAGEMSDGAHNFGFSQYASVFHPNSYDFREYSDKMATYLFGPTFLDVLIKNGQDKDPVWNFFKSTKPNDFLEPLAESEPLIKKQFLTSFFLRAGRMPLARNNSKLLTEFGKQELEDVSFDTYLKEAADNLNGKNLYSTYLKLYNSFILKS